MTCLRGSRAGPACGVGTWAYDLPWRGPVRPPGSASAPALRGTQGKTVMSHPGLQRETLDEMFSVAYEELRRLAASVKRDDPGVTLSPTALVNEAWLKLAKSPGVKPASRLHFKRIAARAMRQVLIEAARRRKADKRGGGTLAITFGD